MPNPHLKRVPRERLPANLQARWDADMKTRDEAVFVEVVANAPELLDWYLDGFYGQIFAKGRVANRIKQLARMKLSTMHGCAYCNKGNAKAALAAGVTQAQLDRLHDVDGGPYDPAEKAVLRLAEQMVMQNFDGYLSKSLYDQLRAHFDDGQIVELGIVLAVLTGMAKFLFVYDLVSREANCPIRLPQAAE
ncbi:MAG: carboxymuconolactone decarboxylase family protein [Alphaproteobacteria bacterium]|nr:carboxymuconolactone decarboxylase family protein [Alphaproteobacteria bacterium]